MKFVICGFCLTFGLLLIDIFYLKFKIAKIESFLIVFLFNLVILLFTLAILFKLHIFLQQDQVIRQQILHKLFLLLCPYILIMIFNGFFYHYILDSINLEQILQLSFQPDIICQYHQNYLINYLNNRKAI